MGLSATFFGDPHSYIYCFYEVYFEYEVTNNVDVVPAINFIY
jgi:hypothetical protein